MTPSPAESAESAIAESGDFLYTSTNVMHNPINPATIPVPCSTAVRNLPKARVSLISNFPSAGESCLVLSLMTDRYGRIVFHIPFARQFSLLVRETA